MRTTYWNCRGLDNDLAVRRLKEIKRKFSPDIICLLETKQGDERVEEVCKELGYEKFVTVTPVGLSGGVALLWYSVLSISVISQSSNLVDCYVQSNEFGFYLSCIYGFPEPLLRHILWNS